MLQFIFKATASGNAQQKNRNSFTFQGIMHHLKLWGQILLFSEQRKVHIDLVQRKTCECKSCISNDFGVEWKWVLPMAVCTNGCTSFSSTGWWKSCLNFSNFTLKRSFTPRRLFFIWSFSTLPRYFVKVMVLAGWRIIMMISFNVLLVSKLTLRRLWFLSLYFHCDKT